MCHAVLARSLVSRGSSKNNDSRLGTSGLGLGGRNVHPEPSQSVDVCPENFAAKQFRSRSHADQNQPRDRAAARSCLCKAATSSGSYPGRNITTLAHVYVDLNKYENIPNMSKSKVGFSFVIDHSGKLFKGKKCSLKDLWRNADAMWR